MFGLVQDLWAIQGSSSYSMPINVPQTIVLLPTKPLTINWFFSGQENRILRRKGEKVTLENVFNYFKKQNQTQLGSHKVVAAIFTSLEEQFQIDSTAVDESIQGKFVNLQELHEFVMHHNQFPNLLDRVTIIQEYQHDTTRLSCNICKLYISVAWNPHYNFVRQCNERSYKNELYTVDHLETANDLKLSPHFRSIIDKTTTELVQKIESFYQNKRGKLLTANLLFKVFQDKLYFYWCSQAEFERDILIRNVHYQQGQGQFWQKANHFTLKFKGNQIRDKCENGPRFLLKLAQTKAPALTARGAQTDRSMPRDNETEDTPASYREVSKSKSINRLSFKIDQSVQDSFRSSTNSQRNRHYRGNTIVNIQPLIEKVNKNRSHSFCRAVKTIPECVESKPCDQSQLNLSSRIKQDSTRQPFSLRLNNLLDTRPDNTSFSTSRQHAQENCKTKTPYVILRKITNSLDQTQENNQSREALKLPQHRPFTPIEEFYLYK